MLEHLHNYTFGRSNFAGKCFRPTIEFILNFYGISSLYAVAAESIFLVFFFFKIVFCYDWIFLWTLDIL